MMAKEKLPIEVHDHFQKANLLHGYVEKSLGEAKTHALEVGQELIAAKAAIPHGRWEDECDRLFSGSASTARFYMQFAGNMEALPKRQQAAIWLLESTLKGAAGVAKKAAKPKPKPDPEPDPDEAIDVESVSVEEEPEEDYDEEFPEDETLEELCKRETSVIESWARKLAKLMDEAQINMCNFPTLDELNARDGWERKFKEALATLRGTKPVVCPACTGDGGKNCTCKGNGRVTKQQYGQMV